MMRTLIQLTLSKTCLTTSCLCLVLMPERCHGRILHVELISLGTISPFSTTSLAFIAPAMETTKEELQRGGYFQHLRMSLSLLYNETALDGTEVPFYSDQMMANWYYQERSRTANLSVIILPGGSEDIYINRLAANWNLLFITCGSTKAVQRVKKLSPSWISTAAYSTTDAARLYARISLRYNWTSLFVVYDRTSSPIFNTANTAVVDQLRTSALYSVTTATINRKNALDCRNALRLFATVSRVLLFFGHAEPFRWFMIMASQMNMTNKDFVYIVLEPFHHNLMGNYTWKINDNDDTVRFELFNDTGCEIAFGNTFKGVKDWKTWLTIPAVASSAFKSVLFLAPQAFMIGESDWNLSSEWRRRSKEEYNYTYASGELFVPYVSGARYTIHMLAEILNETLSNANFDYQNGNSLAKMISNRTFVVDNTEIFMDEYGQRQLNWSLSYFDDELGNFRPFLIQNGKLQTLQETAPLKWYDSNKLPANEPFCGYRGLRSVCLQSANFGNTYGFVLCGLLIGIMIALVIGIIMRKESFAQMHKSWWCLNDTGIGFSKISYQAF